LRDGTEIPAGNGESVVEAPTGGATFSGIGFPGMASVDFEDVATIQLPLNSPFGGSIVPANGLNSAYVFSENAGSRLAVGGRIQLTKIPPGEYLMQVVVFDSLRKDKSRVASQTIDFQVRP
jgi:hypothetical protein